MNANSQPLHAALTSRTRPAVRVAIAGFGATGRALVERISRGDVPGVTLAAVSARDIERVKAALAEMRCGAVAVPIAELAQHADLLSSAPLPRFCATSPRRSFRRASTRSC